ncbi:unnamed protein product, partial [Tetraodon nigroviridis]
MLRPCAALWSAAVVLCVAAAQYSSDHCDWRGSGLSHEAHRRDVEQVYLRCSQGSLEWLYPTGAIIVNLRPNTAPTAALHLCIKPYTYSQGSHVYLERAGELTLLLAEGEHAQAAVRCFPLGDGALFVEAVPATDIGRRITALQYELVSPRGPGGQAHPYLSPASCEPCSDEEVLLAVCTSDFAGVGSVEGVASGTGDAASAVAALSRLFRQKSPAFVRGPARGGRWRGRVRVPRRCGAPPPADAHLLTGSIHFGEAWLGCARRYGDFLQLYRRAERAGTNPCRVGAD